MNQRTVQAFAGPRSEVRMPFFVAQPEVDELGSAPKGEVIAEIVSVAIARRQRRVWFYLPPGYAAATDALYPVVYVLDGANYVEKMDVPKVLDHLIANKTIPPVIAVFSEPADRQEEYSRNPKWRAFIANELVPSVDKRFRTFPTPDHRVILGSSLAAYGAIDLAVAAPSVFGLCAAIAPPAQTATVVSNQAAARAAVVSIKFFVMGGVYDSMIDGARRLHTTLDEYSAPVSYLEVSEGHNTNTFRAPPGRRPEGAPAASSAGLQPLNGLEPLNLELDRDIYDSHIWEIPSSKRRRARAAPNSSSWRRSRTASCTAMTSRARSRASPAAC